MAPASLTPGHDSHDAAAFVLYEKAGGKDATYTATYTAMVISSDASEALGHL